MNNCRNTIKITLSGIPGLEAHWDPNSSDRLVIHVAGRTAPFLVAIRNSGYPRDVREALWRARQDSASDERILVAAPSLSPGSREWLRGEGVAYADADGHMFLVADGVYIFRDDTNDRKHAERRTFAVKETNIYRGRAAQVLHALLRVPDHQWHVTDLAREAGVAAGTALRVCEALDKMLLMEREGRGPRSLRRLTGPGKLLDAWASAHTLSTYSVRQYYRWQADLHDLARIVGAAVQAQGHPYAATLALGATLRAPILSGMDQVSLLIPRDVDLDRLATECDLKDVDDGGNLLLLVAPNNGPFMYRHDSDGISVANDIQLYLDLSSSLARGKEQAHHLRQERIGF